ncbi:phospholipid-translocating P-type ATPase [Piedraia hortae CBS 480.64]|uniref:Phospholipid-transporting ATPase n=1 Tax=Piedraia hortae CBS 480.64 TaxID=1314780 RepID=A0A6A7C6Q4_9PEZI|nr:phospholipid-translocating P-type ATPase [Piedraia hortae CBS 480.64]
MAEERAIELARVALGEKKEPTALEKDSEPSRWTGINGIAQRVRKTLLHIQDVPPSKDGRHIPLDLSREQTLTDERTNKPYISNLIRSSKYTVWSFLPRQLIAQFSKLANAYFLCVSILQMIPGLSTTGRYTTIVPLIFFVSISMAKEGFEDFRRHRLDRAENNRLAKVMRAKATGWAELKWQALHVGNVVKLSRNDAAPADMVLLQSSGPNSTAYFETMALDGETNLKNKQPPSLLVGASIETLKAEVVAEDPNSDLYNFEGRVVLDGESAPLTTNEVVYRGSTLRNTSEAIGLVVYSGEECKIRMNANKNPRIKAPALQTVVNKIVVFMVCFVFLLSLFESVAYLDWKKDTERRSWYLRQASVPFGQVIVAFIIMFNTLIPLSLYVSLEIIKVIQMLWMNQDIDMYDAESNTPFEARTSTINEELGQVSYVFSDKTGTLTENVMRFRKLSVAGTSWLHDADLKEELVMLLHEKRNAKGKLQQPSSDGRKSTSQWSSPATRATPGIESSTAKLIRYIQRHPHTEFARKARLIILSMAVCHTCLPERDDTGEITYQASSPDELALVQAAAELGYVAWDRDMAKLTLQTHSYGPKGQPEYEVVEIMDVLEFSSKRKRMSVIVRFADGRTCLVCKGADSVVIKRLRLAALAQQKLSQIEGRVRRRKSEEAERVLQRRSEQVERTSNARRTSNRASTSRPSIKRLESIPDAVEGWISHRESYSTPSVAESRYYTPRPSMQQGVRPSLGAESAEEDEDLVEEALVVDDAAVIERCFQHVNDYATDGLRTLLFGYRYLEEEEYQSWKRVYREATTSLVNRQERIEEACEMVEQQLELAGATAIEDKLQKGVPETIERLRRANIKMWMLTGDKRETAINIGHSCGLIKDYSAVTVLDSEAGDVEEKITATVRDINNGGVAHSVVVIDGQTLANIQTDTALHALFLGLAILADSVVCCRASPSQKAGLVHAIRRRVSHSVTLAIGDGANDIAMIQEAHVGIGITGKEGLQAARTSDYSIAQFRFLAKLLLVHGRWNYIRTCKYTVGTFWKEMVFYLTQGLYQRWVGYTGTSLYEPWSLSMFNTLFTSILVIFLGVLEQDLRASTLIAVPELYTKGQRAGGFNFIVYFGWMLMAVSESVIIYFVAWGLYGRAGFAADQSIYPLGVLTFSAAVFLCATKLQVLEQRNRTWLAGLCWLISVGGWTLWNIILSSVYGRGTNPQYRVRNNLLHDFGRSGLWWLTLVLAITSCLLLEVVVRALKCAFFPTDVEMFQVVERDLAARKRLEDISAPWLQAGRDHGSKKTSEESQREAEVQAQREGEVEELLKRARVREERQSRRRTTDYDEMLSRGFGAVRD